MTPTMLAKGHNPAGRAGTSPTVLKQGERDENGGQGQPRHVHGDEAAPRLGWEVSPCVRVWINRVHIQG